MILIKLLYYGTIKMIGKSNGVIFYYGCLLITLIVLLLTDNTDLIHIWILLASLSALILGIYYYRTVVLPVIRMREFFHGVFKEIRFEANGRIPYFLFKQEISRFVTVYSFKTYFPLKMWLSKSDYIEMYMQRKIIDIEHSENNNQIVNIITESEPLPEYIDWHDEYISSSNKLNIGVGHYGTVGMSLDKNPHAFIAGETGSGKSNILKCLIHQALLKRYDIVLIDFKRGVSFSEFSNHVAVYYDYKSVTQVLKNLVDETYSRLDNFRYYRVDNFKDFNRVSNERIKRKIIFIDELAELLRTKDKETSRILNDNIETLTRLCRAVGIHLIMGIQRPDSTVVSGQIKNNVPLRVCGRFVDKEPSRIMLGSDEANTLPNIKGRFLIKDDGLIEVQSFYFYREITIPERVIEPPPKMEPVAQERPTERPQQARKKWPPQRIENKVPITAPTPVEPKPEIPKRPLTIDDIEFDFSEFRK